MGSITYFQRYSQKENTVTNNTLLCLSKLYEYNPVRFQDFLNDILPDIPIEVGVDLKQQTRAKKGIKKVSTPDGQLSQSSFKIVVETKLGNKFTIRQIKDHLSAFSNETVKVLFLLNPEPIAAEQRTAIEKVITDFNEENESNIRLVATNFEALIDSYDHVLEDRDYSIRDILQDYLQYCDDEGLLPRVDHTMRAVTCGITLEENLQFNLYYDPADRTYRNHRFVGLYKNKSIRGIGEVENIIQADMIANRLKIINSTEQVTADQIRRITDVIPHAKRTCGYNIQKNHQFFLVKEFFPTDYRKATKGGIMSRKYFDLKKVLHVEDLPDTEHIANILMDLEW